jgi:hypothetical protein
LLDIHVYWNILTMHGPINVKFLSILALFTNFVVIIWHTTCNFVLCFYIPYFHYQNTLCKTIMKHLVPNLKCVLLCVLLYFKFFLCYKYEISCIILSLNDCHINNLSFVKQQFLVTRTIRQTEIGLRTHLLSRCCVHRNIAYRKNITRLSLGLLQIGELFVSPVKLCIVGSRQIAVSWAMYPLPRYLNCVMRSKIGLCNGPVNTPPLPPTWNALYCIAPTNGGGEKLWYCFPKILSQEVSWH